MNSRPIIGFCQQPCGIFPKRFLFAKIETARRLQAQIGGEIVFFYHDSDHDSRETKTILRHRKTNEPISFNFTFENKIQRKFSPLYLKRVLPDWHFSTLRQLPNFVNRPGIDLFQSVAATNVADFCLEMYKRMGVLEGIRVVRSSDVDCRQKACDVDDFFVDIPYLGEVVRARYSPATLQLHQGGDSFLTLPPTSFVKAQISPTRDTRLKWMQSVLQYSHYVAGAGEKIYMRQEDAPEITYIARDPIEFPNEAYTDFLT